MSLSTDAIIGITLGGVFLLGGGSAYLLNRGKKEISGDGVRTNPDGSKTLKLGIKDDFTGPEYQGGKSSRNKQSKKRQHSKKKK